MAYYEEQGEEPNQSVKQLLLEQALEKEKSRMRRTAFWAIGFGVAVTAIHIGLLAAGVISLRTIFHSIWFVFGALGLLIGGWTLYEAKKLSLEDIIPSRQAIEFARLYEAAKPIYSYLLIGCFVAVFLFQSKIGIDESVLAAGLVKPFVWQGEFWRLLTSATLHGGIIHIYFNSQALHGFGKLIEAVGNRAHVAIVFVLAALAGSVFSLVLMPDTASIGASGGVMGLVGYLVVFGYRRKRDLPPNFLRNVIVNVVFIGAIGLLGAAFIDNAAHAGGFLAGLIYGFLTIPKDGTAKNDSFGVVSVLGIISLVAVICAAAFSIWRMS